MGAEIKNYNLIFRQNTMLLKLNRIIILMFKINFKNGANSFMRGIRHRLLKRNDSFERENADFPQFIITSNFEYLSFRC